MLTISYFPKADPETFVVDQNFIIKNDDGSDLTDTLVSSRFIMVDHFGDTLVEKTINNGLSWDQELATLNLKIANKDVAFASDDVDARYAIYITWDNGTTQQIVPPPPEEYDFAKVIRVL